MIYLPVSDFQRSVWSAPSILKHLLGLVWSVRTRGAGGNLPWSPQFLAVESALLQPWWQIMPTTLLPFLFKLGMNASMILKTSKLKIIFFYLKYIEQIIGNV